MGQGHPSQSEQHKRCLRNEELCLLREREKGYGRRVGGTTPKEMNSVVMDSSCTLTAVGATWTQACVRMTELKLLFHCSTANQQKLRGFGKASSWKCGMKRLPLILALPRFSAQGNGQLTMTTSKGRATQILSCESKPGAESFKEGSGAKSPQRAVPWRDLLVVTTGAQAQGWKHHTEDDSLGHTGC